MLLSFNPASSVPVAYVTAGTHFSRSAAITNRNTIFPHVRKRFRCRYTVTGTPVCRYQNLCSFRVPGPPAVSMRLDPARSALCTATSEKLDPMFDLNSALENLNTIHYHGRV